MESSTYTFRIQITSSNRVQTAKRDPQNKLLGEPAGDLRLAPNQDALQQLCHKAHAGSIRDAEIRTLGALLFNTLFDDALGQNFLTFYQDVVFNRQALLRLELDIDPDLPELVALPWEYLCTPPNNQITGDYVFLGTAADLILSRRYKSAIAPPSIRLRPQEKLRVAVVVSTPRTDGEEALGPVSYSKLFQELQKLATQLGDAVELLLFDPETDPATRDTVDAVLEQHKPHIFHFVGHGRFHEENGQSGGQIAMVRDNGRAHWITGPQFSSFFTRHRPGIILLQTCEGGKTSAQNPFASVAAQVVKHNIPVVVAMQHTITNASARRFAREFYRRLAQNQPVDKAVQEGRYKISNFHETRDFATPILFMHDRDGRLFNRTLITIDTPDKAAQSEALRKALSRLDYDNQRNKFGEILWQPLRLGAFLITGPPDAGQQWLLKLLVEEISSSDTPHDPKQLDVGNRIYIRLGLSRLWGDLAEKMGLAFDAQPEAVRQKIISEWQKQDILIILHNIARNDPDLPQILIDEIWQPLVNEIVQRPERASANRWLTLFMVDHEGHLGHTNLELMEITEAGWQPTSPVQLPQLREQFADEDLRNWLKDRETRNALAPANLEPPTFVETVLAQSAGIPMEVLKTVCRLCKQNWSDVEKVWLKL